MQLTTECRRQSIDITVQDVFQEKTIAHLSRCAKIIDFPHLKSKSGYSVDNSQNKPQRFGGELGSIQPFSLVDKSSWETVIQAAMEQCHIVRNEIEDIYPTSALQEALMASTVKRKGMYTAEFTFQLHENVSIDNFKAAWQATVLANPILRTRIIHTEALGSFQVVLSGSRIEWGTFQFLDAYLAAKSQEHMTLGHPLARFALIPNSDSRPPNFVLTIHHSTYGKRFPVSH